MQFTLASVLGLAATVAALPPSAGGFGNGNGLANKGNTDVKFPVPDSMTVKQAQAKCGDQAQLSCCNKATYAGDTTDVNSGMLAGVLGNLVGAGSGADGLGLFDQCSKLDLQSKLYSISRYLESMLIITSPHPYCRPHPGLGQPEVQAEHRLLPELPLDRRLRPHRSWPALRCPWLHPLSVSLCFLALCWKQWSPRQPSWAWQERERGPLTILGHG
jgi:hypothetical protein